MELCFITAMDGGMIDIDNKVMYGGNLFRLHCCVQSIEALPDVLKSLEQKQ